MASTRPRNGGRASCCAPRSRMPGRGPPGTQTSGTRDYSSSSPASPRKPRPRQDEQEALPDADQLTHALGALVEFTEPEDATNQPESL